MQTIKRFRLIGITLAVACGLVLAHVVNKLFDDLDLANSLINNCWTLVGWGIVAGLLALVVWRRRGVLAWLGRHKKGVGYSAFAVAVLCSALIAIAVLNEREANAEAIRQSQEQERQRQAQLEKDATEQHGRVYEATQKHYQQFKSDHPRYKGDCEKFLKDEADAKLWDRNTIAQDGPLGATGVDSVLASQDYINLSPEAQREFRSYKCHI
jgi:hypothetical protein